MSTTIQEFQELAHGDAYDYIRGAPHLKHPRLYQRLLAAIRLEVRRAVERGLPATVLDVGAGHGPLAEPLLASGVAVTATEMSRASISELDVRFGANPAFDVVFDPDGSLEALGDRRFALVLYASVIHHVPDYVDALRVACERHVLLGGGLVTLQDPLWYPSVRRGVRAADQAMYLSWRLAQGDLLRGLGSRLRRARGDLRTAEPAHMVEYHVVRSGVDQSSIERLLRPRFAEVEVRPYWSSHAAVWQSLGERLGLENTFAVFARGYRGGKPRVVEETRAERPLTT